MLSQIKVTSTAAFLKLPGCEPRALQQGPGFVGEDLDLFFLLESGIDHPESGAVVGRGQAAGIAMSKGGLAIFKESSAVAAESAADVPVVRKDAFGLLQQSVAQLPVSMSRSRVEDVPHPFQRPEQVDRRGPGAFEAGDGPADLAAKIIRVAGHCIQGSEDYPVGGGYADGGCAANLQVLDRRGNGFHLAAGEVVDLGGKSGLVEKDEGVVLPFKGLDGHQEVEKTKSSPSGDGVSRALSNVSANAMLSASPHRRSSP